MNEKILTVLVVVSLVLSVFSLFLTFRSDGTNAIANLGEPSNVVTWKKVQYDANDSGVYWGVIYNTNGVATGLDFLNPLWNITVSIQWKNGTMQVNDLGDTKLNSYLDNSVTFPKTWILRYDDRYHIWNITSITAYAIQTPQ